MHTIDLTYVGSGIHEELIAYVADQEGYFEDEGVHVAVRDGIRWDERCSRRRNHRFGPGPVDAADSGHPMDCAGRQHPSSAVLVPRVWRGEIHGSILAGADGDPPTPHRTRLFARIVLRRHGLDPDRDLECVAHQPRGDYQMDLRGLRDGSIDAAYVGSTLAPEQVAGEEGFAVLSWVGDHFQIPTVGIAVDPDWIPLTTRVERGRGPTSEPGTRSPNNPSRPSTTSPRSSTG